ncbi:transmembrane channel-like protein 7 isoform X2 [Nematostella vectensis]|uniref:transmembrane channel-like protein 7 isoform X2 n=1 Tax=Nematostella vectensis TaxID=45351 RepID=UPI0020770094|nr:transmembrane channel-like protein 7 isoform X2 [Nematostella vectensis]
MSSKGAQKLQGDNASEVGDPAVPMTGSDGSQSTSERERSIINALPSRQIATWRLKSKKRLSRQKSSGGKMYMSLEDDKDDESPVLLEIPELAGKEGKYIQTRPLHERLTERKRLRSATAHDPRSLSCFTTWRLRVAMHAKRAYKKARDTVHLDLWRGHLKEIEGTFGNGILSYFTFLKWLLLLNGYIFLVTLAFLVIPQAIHTQEISAVIVTPMTSLNQSINSTQPIPTPNALKRNQSYVLSARGFDGEKSVFLGANASQEVPECYGIMSSANTSHVIPDIGAKISNFMQGVGWINTTLMFYGSYSAKILLMPDRLYYNMPFAYFVVNGACFVFVLLITLWSVSSIFEESYVKEGVRHYNSYSNKVFGSWDMCIVDEQAAELKMRTFLMEVEADLAEDLRLASLAKRTRLEKCQTYSIRALINLVVIGLSAVAGYVIYEAAQLSLKSGQSSSQLSPTNQKEMIELLKGYASSLTLSILNAVLPALFFYLAHLEDWNPRVRINVDLSRTVLLKLASVAVLMISLFEKINTDKCMLCWENAIAAEMYKLIWMDFIMSVLVVLLFHTPRRYAADHLGKGIGQKIGRPVFSIPQNVLELVYAQCLIWIGMWFSPLLPLMGCVKFFILFYTKKVNLKYNCRTEDKAYRAGRSNYFFMVLLLGTFFLCVAAVAYGVTQGLDHMYDIIILTIRTLPLEFQDVYVVISSPFFLIVVVLIICLGLYFFYATAKIYSRMIRGLREELSMESRDKRYLLKQITADDNNKRTEGAV